MKVTFEPLPEMERLGALWRQLEEQAADSSFFQSWTWIGAWLRALSDPSCIRLLTIEHDGSLVGLGLVGRRTLRRHRVLPVRSLFVSGTGDPALDTLTMEHNGLLLASGIEVRAIRAALAALAANAEAWDEIRIAGVECRNAAHYRAAFPLRGCRLLARNEKPYFTIALDRLRDERRDFLSSLSSNTRSQVRRSMREYEKRGALNVRIAADEEEARMMFGRLRELHQEYWQARGAPGAFATPFANAFHGHLIAAGMPRGEIQLGELVSGAEPIGYLYNFVHRGAVLNYQSGLRYESDAKLKPGLVAHTLLIEENLRRGARIYDLLMGNQRYKRSLATDEGTMCELVVQRERLRFRLENLARVARDALRRSAANEAATT